MSPPEQQAFSSGYAEGLDHYRDKFGELLH